MITHRAIALTIAAVRGRKLDLMLLKSLRHLYMSLSRTVVRGRPSVAPDIGSVSEHLLRLSHLALWRVGGLFK